MDQLTEHLRFFQELGVTGVSRDVRWRDRPAGSAVPETAQPIQLQGGEAPEPPRAGDAVPIEIARSSREALTLIRTDIGDCTRCKLSTQGRQQIVFGVGHPDAEIMFVGEAPGADEDVQGIPFVGRAGQLLTKMIEAMGLTRDEVYIANVVKCRPPGNRNPEPDEIATCQPFLFRQIASVQPAVIIALGAFAAKTLLNTETPIGKLRGRLYAFQGATLIPTFHPSFLLRSPGYKREAWDDLKKALGVLGRVAPAPASSSSPSSAS